MAVRINTTEILANMLDSKNMFTGAIISDSILKKFEFQLDMLIPSHVFYEDDDKERKAAVEKFDFCCRWIDHDGEKVIQVTNTDSKPDRNYYNNRLNKFVGEVLPSFADAFIEKFL